MTPGTEKYHQCDGLEITEFICLVPLLFRHWQDSGLPAASTGPQGRDVPGAGTTGTGEHRVHLCLAAPPFPAEADHHQVL